MSVTVLLLSCISVTSAMKALEYDDDYIEIRHDDGALSGMRAVPISSGGRLTSTMQDDEDFDGSYRDALQDDFDGSDGEMIHVIRRTPEVAQQVIEFDPVGGQVHKGILRQQHDRKDHSLKSKSEDRDGSDARAHEPNRHFHEDGHLVFDAIENDVNKNDIKKIKTAIGAKRKRDKDLAKRLTEYEKRLSSTNALRRKSSLEASKKLTKLLTKEDREAQKRKKNLDGRDEKVRREKLEADRLTDTALTERDVKDIVSAVHSAHGDSASSSLGEKIPLDVVSAVHSAHGDSASSSLGEKILAIQTQRKKSARAKGLYKAEQKRLKEEDKAARQLLKEEDKAAGKLQKALDNQFSHSRPRETDDDPQPQRSTHEASRHRDEIEIHHKGGTNRAVLRARSKAAPSQHSSILIDADHDALPQHALTGGSAAFTAARHGETALLAAHQQANAADATLDDLLAEFHRWKHLNGNPKSSTNESKANDLKALTAEYAKWRKRQRAAGGRGGGGRKGGAKVEKQSNNKDALLEGSLEDFETWKRMREDEEDEGY